MKHITKTEYICSCTGDSFFRELISFVSWWSDLVFDALDRLMVEPICCRSNWFQLIGLIEARYEEYCLKSKSLFVLEVSFDLRLDRKCFLVDILIG